MLVRSSGRLHLLQRRGGQLDRRVQRQRGELLSLRLVHRLGLLRRELLDPAQELLGVAAERETEAATFHALRLPEVDAVRALDFALKRVDDLARPLHRRGEGRALDCAAESSFQPPGRGADLVEADGSGEDGRRPEHVLELERGRFCLVDPRRILCQPKRSELGAKVVEIAARSRFGGELAEGEDRDRVAHATALRDRLAVLAERQPGANAPVGLEGAQVHPLAGLRLGGEHRGRTCELRDPLELLRQRHRRRIGPDYDGAVIERIALAVAILSLAVAVAAFFLARTRRPDPSLEAAREKLRAIVTEETAASADELKMQLARMRADSLSTLAKEERKIADERRHELGERERAAGEQLADTLATTTRRVDERLRAWTDDLERAQQNLEAQLRKLEQRQQQLIAEAETRIEAEAAELVSTSEEQRASVLRLREELERSAQAAVAEALEELEAHTGERRRVIEEIAERLRRREQALTEQVERGESEAARRIEASFADVERRQVEQLQRVISREAERYAEAAGQQFEASMRAAREEAAVRLSRELDRAVETFVRQADTVFAERLSHTGDAGQQRFEARQRQAQADFERQRDELAASFADRVAAADAELRRTLGAFAAEAESERAMLAMRLAELSRRVEEASAARRS